LKKGSSGVCVKTLQNLLNARGFNTNGVDGKFGQQTHDAVVCAQKSNGLTPDGIVGPKTWAALAG
jgi:peptidoglycan hydrolase-like protein with peptidoglycan-binding domain